MSRVPSILVVDDEPFNVDLLQQELEDLGYTTRVAYDGQQALDRVAEEPPDLILLDVMMPVLDGFSVCRRLKSDDETRFIPIVIMTALDDVEDRIKGIEAGADDFLTKPVDDRELKARIQTALRMKEALDAKVNRLHQTGRHLAKFVPEVVRRRVAENPEAPELDKRDQDSSVLFLDICGYTSLSQQMSPGELSSLVEHYFSAFLDRVHEHGGQVSETSGDGMMVIFQHEDPEEHAARAVRAALAVDEEVKALNARNGRAIDLHMGVNSGLAAVGSTRYRGASGERWVFTADGLAINVAARLASIAEPGQILIGPETARRVDHHVALAPVGTRHLKNVAEPVEVHRLVSERP